MGKESGTEIEVQGMEGFEDQAITTKARGSLFDKPLVEVLQPTWEKAIYTVIAVLAVVSRFVHLGIRAMSHDESLHALYSYYLYNGTGYRHDPMMHGPFKFHATALVYFLLGDNDYTARIPAAVFGVFLVLSPLLLRRWLGRTGAIITSLLLLIAPSILYYSRYTRDDIMICVWSVLLVAALFRFLQDHKRNWFYMGAAVLMLSLTTMEGAYLFGFLALVFIAEVVLWERVSQRNRLWLYVSGLILCALLLTGGILLGNAAAQAAADAQAAAAAAGTTAAEGAGKWLKLLSSLLILCGGVIPPVLFSSVLIPSRHPARNRIAEAVRSLSGRAWLIAIAIVVIIYALLFTTFFTNPAGLITGIGGSVSYWMAQQDVQRGGQPWYYYGLLLPMYEFVPLLFSLIAMAYYLIRRPFGNKGQGEETGNVTGAGLDAIFVAWLTFWSLGALFIYSWAGEKMPWLVVHIALPMIFLTGKFAGDVFSRVDWRAVWQRGGALLAGLLPITLFGLYTLIRVRPFQGLSIFKLQETGNWLLALLVTLALLALTVMTTRRVGARHSLLVGLGTLLVLLSAFTVRTAWRASYINFDYATEMLVYAHGAADVVPTMSEVADISKRTVGDKMIAVAYDNEVIWPLEWYMREYPNRKYFADNPTRESTDVPVILFSERNEGKVRPFLGERYNCTKRRLVWWPNQQYMGLTWERIRNILGSAEKRAILWDILYWRKYPQTPDNWYHVHNFQFCVRKDVAQQIWNWGAAPPETSVLPADPYAESHVELTAEAVWGTVGTGAGQFNHPRGIAVGPDGNVYVVDSDNARVQVFGPDGTFLHQWGSSCAVTESDPGCVDPDGNGPLATGDGQFNEPWGIAVGGDGRVYVADTWNHRIQVFDADGTFVTKWGTFGETTSLESVFYGPRDVAIDPGTTAGQGSSGRVFVTDTGNKRVLVYEQDGTLVEQIGGAGSAPGQLSEPVGIDVDAEGNIYVADTWNQRIQVFDKNLIADHQWQVDAWYGSSVVNKPFLAVDGQGRVYVTDPEGYRVDVFDAEGQVTATFGTYGADAVSFVLPTGIAIGGDGSIYVTDTDGQRVMRFGALP